MEDYSDLVWNLSARNPWNTARVEGTTDVDDWLDAPSGLVTDDCDTKFVFERLEVSVAQTLATRRNVMEALTTIMGLPLEEEQLRHVLHVPAGYSISFANLQASVPWLVDGGHVTMRKLLGDETAFAGLTRGEFDGHYVIQHQLPNNGGPGGIQTAAPTMNLTPHSFDPRVLAEAAEIPHLKRMSEKKLRAFAARLGIATDDYSQAELVATLESLLDTTTYCRTAR